MAGAEVQQKLSGHLLLMRGAALRERVHRRLDASQTPDVGERQCNGATLNSVQRARRRARWCGGRQSRGRIPAAVAATSGCHGEHGEGERDS
jgi:hypothetical protein